MSSQPNAFITPEEYLESERQAETKSEYFNGAVFAMAGGTPRHVDIVRNLIRSLDRQFSGRECSVYFNDLRLRVSPTGLYTYPDVMVIWGGLQFADTGKDTVTNPVVIVEVLSPSTRDYDRGAKFHHYRTIDSFQEYLTVEQDKPKIEHWVRQEGNRWVFTEHTNASDQVTLKSIGCTLSMSEVYDKIDWT